MIYVRLASSGLWHWDGPAPASSTETRRYCGCGYITSERALRDAWAWCGEATPALVSWIK